MKRQALHAHDPRRSRFQSQQWEADDEPVAATLINEAGKFLRSAADHPLETPEIETWQVKRWRYSKLAVTHRDRFLAVRRSLLVFAGDAFGGPRIEGAALSGLAAAREIAKRMV